MTAEESNEPTSAREPCARPARPASEPLVVAETRTARCGEIIGAVKWFSNTHGYGFITVYSDGDMRGRDVFVHHSGVRPLNSHYRTLHKGEYVSFDVLASSGGPQAVNVTGALGGPLMCDHRPSVRPPVTNTEKSVREDK